MNDTRILKDSIPRIKTHVLEWHFNYVTQYISKNSMTSMIHVFLYNSIPSMIHMC